MLSMKLLIHIGYHKTATTWLQKNLFGNSALPYSNIEPGRSILENIIKPHEFGFDLESCRKLIYSHVHECRSGKTIFVISRERLSGSPFSGGYDSGIIARRLHRIAPYAKILIVIREQKTNVESNL